MNDILKEIQHDIAEEKYQKLFLEHGKKMIAAAVIILLVVSAKAVYWNVQKKKSLEAGNLFVEAFDSSEPESYDAIIAKDQKGFSPLAILMKAGLQNAHDKSAEAIKTLDSFSGKRYDKAFEQIADLDKAYLLIKSKGDKKQILGILDELTKEGAVFWATATELKASYLLEQGDSKQAAELYRKLSTNNVIPSTMQERAKNVLSSINE